MHCRHCGIEIAEKALICFKCGTATTEAVHKGPVRSATRWSPSALAPLILLDGVALVGVYLGLTSTSPTARLVGWSLFIVGAALVVASLLSRRR